VIDARHEVDAEQNMAEQIVLFSPVESFLTFEPYEI
jgi:hypothetical protein